jgi:hypothetical protein
MLIGEFNSKFTSQEEGSYLFEVMRKLSQLDSKALLATEVQSWAEWPPIDPDDPGLQVC